MSALITASFNVAIQAAVAPVAEAAAIAETVATGAATDGPPEDALALRTPEKVTVIIAAAFVVSTPVDADMPESASSNMSIPDFRMVFIAGVSLDQSET